MLVFAKNANFGWDMTVKTIGLRERGRSLIDNVLKGRPNCHDEIPVPGIPPVSTPTLNTSATTQRSRVDFSFC